MNILDYLDWRGDLSFAAAEIGEVDALIFAWLSYYRFEELGEAAFDGLTLAELAALHERKLGPIQKLNPKTTIEPSVTAAWLLRSAASTPRFSSVRARDFKRAADAERGIQFAAVSFLIDGGPRVVAFRGTDNTLAGWKEDCYLAFSEAVPAQKLAERYLEGTADGREALVCGHSKGGNLAMYAALHASDARLADVRRVYNFDGPGFNFDLQKSERYNRVRERVDTIVPESSVVGMLLNHEEDYRIVRSQMAGILQHDAMFWQVLGPRFVYADKRNASSVYLDRTLRGWIDGMSFEERKEFVDAVFSVLESTGATLTSELPEKIAQTGVKNLLSADTLNPEQKRMVLRLLLNLLKAGNANLYDSMLRSELAGEIAKGLADGTSYLSGAIDRGLDALTERLGSGRGARERAKSAGPESLPEPEEP